MKIINRMLPLIGKKPGIVDDIPLAINEWHQETIEQFGARYQITGNRIGIKLLPTKPEKEMWWPLADYQQDGKTRQKGLSPDAILSTHELSGLFFYQFLYQEGWITDSTEDFLANYLYEWNSFLKAVKNRAIKPIEYIVHLRKGRKKWDKH